MSDEWSVEREAARLVGEYVHIGDVENLVRKAIRLGVARAAEVAAENDALQVWVRTADRIRALLTP